MKSRIRKNKILAVGAASSLASAKLKYNNKPKPVINTAALAVISGRPVCHLQPNTLGQNIWDFYMLGLLTYTAIVTPYEMGFLPIVPYEDLSQSGSLLVLFVINKLVDISFFMDLMLHFFLGYHDRNLGHVVYRDIPCIYLKGWFIVDLLSVLPFDLLVYGMDAVDVGASYSINALRIVRLLKLVKLARLVRVMRMFKRWETKIGWSFGSQSLIRFSVLIICAIHWVACFLPVVSRFDPEESWNNWMIKADIKDAPVSSQYIVALYWSTMTMTTIGYGDITAANQFERVWNIIAMLIGAMLYTFIMGKVYRIIVNMNQADTDFYNTMDQLNNYMKQADAPPELRDRLRSYFSSCRSNFSDRYNQSLLSRMSPGLRGEFASWTHRGWLKSVYFLNMSTDDEGNSPTSFRIDTNSNKNRIFLTKIAQRLKFAAFPQKETVVFEGEPTEIMYIIRKGLVGVKGKVVRAGQIFGEDIILEHGMRPYFAYTLTFVQTMTLSRTALFQELNSGNFEMQAYSIRRATVRLALLYCFQEIVRRIKILKVREKITNKRIPITLMDVFDKEGNMFDPHTFKSYTSYTRQQERFVPRNINDDSLTSATTTDTDAKEREDHTKIELHQIDL